jgi:hypothetical protein
MISRCAFMLQTASAVTGARIAPGFYERILRHIDCTDQPLLEPPARTQLTLQAYENDDYVLSLGSINQMPPPITLREYLKEYLDIDPETLSPEELEFDYWFDPAQLDKEYESDFYYDA